MPTASPRAIHTCPDSLPGRQLKSRPLISCPLSQQLLSDDSARPPDDSTRQSIPDPSPWCTVPKKMFGSAPPKETSETLEIEAEADAAEAVLATDRALAQQLVSWGGSPWMLALAPAAAREAVEAAEDDPRGAAAVDVGDEALDIEAVLAADRALAQRLVSDPGDEQAGEAALLIGLSCGDMSPCGCSWAAPRSA